MSAQPRHNPETGWVTLAEGIEFSQAWLDDRAPRLHRAWRRARTERQRRRYAARILRVADQAEREEPADSWIEIAHQIHPQLTHGPDWARLAAALSRADAAGFDVAANLPRLAESSPLPDRHPARELHWRLLVACEGAAADPLTPSG